jgi:hypothetical protein
MANWSTATSAKCELCGHGLRHYKNWSAFYSVCKSFYIAWCRACGRTKRYER